MKQQNRYNNTALIDADYILWIACNPNKVEDESGKPKKIDGKFVYTPKTTEQAINTCDAYLADILNITHADSYILCLTTGANFRYGIDPSYKANRTGIDKPLWFDEVKQHMVEHWDALEIPGLEADDIVGIIYNNLENTFIIAADKDLLDCIPGRHFDTRKGRVAFITTTEDQAAFNFAKSLLAGDAIDGIHNIKKGYGPKTAERDIKEILDTFTGIDPKLAAYAIYRIVLDHESQKEFEKQYKLLKILDSFEEIPEGINFEMPEPVCFDCIESTLATEEYELKYRDDEE